MIDIETIPVTIDGVEYTGADLDEQGKEILRHLVDVRDRAQQLQFQLCQLDVLDKAFAEALRNCTPKQQEAS